MASRNPEDIVPRPVEVGLTLLLAAGFGVLGLAAVFTDVGPTSTPAARALACAALFLVGGLLIGFLNPRGRAWGLAVLAAWGPAVLGAMGLWIWIRTPASGEPGLALVFLLAPAGVALAGGWSGARVRRALATRRRSRPPDAPGRG